jgi:hypothetical protein
MVKRKVHSDEELRQIFHDNLDLDRLYRELDGLQNVVVLPCGSGSNVFQVYLPGRVGAYEAFLYVREPFDRSLVNWASQGELANVCRDLWGPFVKKPKNPNASQLRENVDIDDVLEKVKQYAAKGEEKRRSGGN